MLVVERIGIAVAVAVLGGCSLIVQPDTSGLLPPADGGLTDGIGGDGAPDVTTVCGSNCDDGVACTVDHCDTATMICTHVPENSQCTGGALCDPVMGCVSPTCTTAAQCMGGDLNMCNGTPMCVGGHCVAGTPLSCPMGTVCAPGTCDPMHGCITGPPPDCDDGNPCTLDSCSSSAGGCVHMVQTTCPPANNQCANAVAFTLSGGSESRMGTTVMATNTTHSVCDPDSAGDVWYAISFPANQDLMVAVDISGGGSNADSVITARDSCASTQDIVCNDDIGDHNRGSRIWIRSVPGAPSTTRTVYIDVQAYAAGAESTFLLTAAVSASIGAATCAGPFFDMSLGGTAFAHTTSHSDGLAPSCAASTNEEPQDVYTCTGVTGEAHATVTATSGGSFMPVLSSRRTCMGADDACEMSNPAEVMFNPVGGTEFILVSNGPPATPTAYWLAVHLP